MFCMQRCYSVFDGKILLVHREAGLTATLIIPCSWWAATEVLLGIRPFRFLFFTQLCIFFRIPNWLVLWSNSFIPVLFKDWWTFFLNENEVSTLWSFWCWWEGLYRPNYLIYIKILRRSQWTRRHVSVYFPFLFSLFSFS